ncbi:MAG TPA: acyl-CoA dehydrogenase family protein [Candidatus Acidoferrales bacterium]|nr:acyl-CoA dehydrogenase family protein [Candidatus Acidoferrales bacterium]
MDLSFSPAEEAFRAELDAWLGDNLPREIPEPDTLADEVAFLIKWQRQLAAGRWVGVHWPTEYGGRGVSVIENYIFQEEMARTQAPEIIGRIGVNLVGPTLIGHGTDTQKRRYLAKILTAEEIWCQLFSEPNAGSDLTALRCRAERDGDEFVINGQKVWTSYAQFAHWGILLARTDAAAPKAKGISFFIVDMRSPGIAIRPLRQMTGSEEFNEVFLENVRIPATNLVGGLNRGWEIAQTTLAHERGTSARQLVVHRILLDELIALARRRTVEGTPAATHPILRQRLAQSVIEVELLKLQNWRTLTQLLRHGKPGPESSLVKLFWSEMSQRLHDTAMEILGVDGQLMHGDARAVAHGRWPRSYLYYRAGTIFAGTSEIQRNIIAERVLGLPRSR